MKVAPYSVALEAIEQMEFEPVRRLAFFIIAPIATRVLGR
jgi:hypothetical protein